MERNVSRLRRRLGKQQKRKANRWKKAFAALETPVALIFAIDDDHPVPLAFLPLLKAKQRIEELNMLLAVSRGEGGAASAAETGEMFIPGRPRPLWDKTVFDLTMFSKHHVQGQAMYRAWVSKGRLQAAQGEWSVLSHAALSISLPTINLRHKRHRDWYVVGVARDLEDRINCIRVYSRTWQPLFERELIYQH